MQTLDYILTKYNLESKPIVEIPDIGRNGFSGLLAELGFIHGAEVGVEAGKYSAILLESNSKLMLYSIDAWASYDTYRAHVSQEIMDLIYQAAVKRLAKYQGRVQLVKAYSLDAVRTFADDALDFVYLDANHSYESVSKDLRAWWKKIRPGGILSGHDYRKNSGIGEKLEVIPALNDFIAGYPPISPLFILGSRAKIAGKIRDSTRSWFICKI